MNKKIITFCLSIVMMLSTLLIVSASNCSDSDNGANAYVAGVVKYASGGIVCGDKCSDRNTLKECYCNEKGTFSVKQLRCPYRCNTDKCQNASIIRCGDFVCNTNETCSTCARDCGGCKFNNTEINNSAKQNIPEKVEIKSENKIAPNSSKEKIGVGNSNCDGCMIDGKCLRYGLRKKAQFCNSDGFLKNQSDKDSSCNNGYECKTNICTKNKCIEGNLFQKIMSWFSG